MPLTDYDTYDFANRRHIGPSPAEMEAMLAVVGCDSLDALIDETVPAAIRQADPLPWPQMTEHAILGRMRTLAAKNRVTTSMIGQGYSDTVTPPAIQRNILENPAWYTAYTPYQPEIAQGRLEALLNFQTMVADLTGLPVANASLLDEATAAAEAMVMARRVARSKARGFFADARCHPQTLAVMRTRAEPLGIELIVGDTEALDPAAVFGAIFQYPDTHGRLRDPSSQIEALHGAGAIAVVATDLLALCLLREPGAMGADVAVGSAQRFGCRWVTAAACRVLRLRGRPQAAHAGAARRGQRRQPRQPRLPPQLADPRAAHPPREGDLQRLHRAGAARGDGELLRGVPRARGASPHRHARPRARGRAARRARGGGVRRRRGADLRHARRDRRRDAGRDLALGARRGDHAAGAWGRTGSGSPATR